MSINSSREVENESIALWFAHVDRNKDSLVNLSDLEHNAKSNSVALSSDTLSDMLVQAIAYRTKGSVRSATDQLELFDLKRYMRLRNKYVPNTARSGKRTWRTTTSTMKIGRPHRNNWISLIQTVAKPFAQPKKPQKTTVDNTVVLAGYERDAIQMNKLRKTQALRRAQRKVATYDRKQPTCRVRKFKNNMQLEDEVKLTKEEMEFRTRMKLLIDAGVLEDPMVKKSKEIHSVTFSAQGKFNAIVEDELSRLTKLKGRQQLSHEPLYKFIYPPVIPPNTESATLSTRLMGPGTTFDFMGRPVLSDEEIHAQKERAKPKRMRKPMTTKRLTIGPHNSGSRTARGANGRDARYLPENRGTSSRDMDVEARGAESREAKMNAVHVNDTSEHVPLTHDKALELLDEAETKLVDTNAQYMRKVAHGLYEETINDANAKLSATVNAYHDDEKKDFFTDPADNYNPDIVDMQTVTRPRKPVKPLDTYQSSHGSFRVSKDTGNMFLTFHVPSNQELRHKMALWQRDMMADHTPQLRPEEAVQRDHDMKLKWIASRDGPKNKMMTQLIAKTRTKSHRPAFYVPPPKSGRVEVLPSGLKSESYAKLERRRAIYLGIKKSPSYDPTAFTFTKARKAAAAHQEDIAGNYVPFASVITKGVVYATDPVSARPVKEEQHFGLHNGPFRTVFKRVGVNHKEFELGDEIPSGK